jgi:hypothetical protein
VGAGELPPNQCGGTSFHAHRTRSPWATGKSAACLPQGCGFVVARVVCRAMSQHLPFCLHFVWLYFINVVHNYFVFLLQGTKLLL